MKATDYALTLKEAEEFKGIVCLSHEFRIHGIKMLTEKYGIDWLQNAFSQIIGMANSVLENNREMIEIILITEGDMHPHVAEKANLPTIFGALHGIKLSAAIGNQRTCAGCAFRHGTPANQSPVTSIDADHCVQDGDDFMCHEDIDEMGNPKHKCVGYALRIKEAA
jgi:hypothetical protein